MSLELHRHDISDNGREKLSRTQLEKRARVEEMLRIHGVFWILRTGAPWRDKGIWENL